MVARVFCVRPHSNALATTQSINHRMHLRVMAASFLHFQKTKKKKILIQVETKGKNWLRNCHDYDVTTIGTLTYGHLHLHIHTVLYKICRDVVTHFTLEELSQL